MGAASGDFVLTVDELRTVVGFVTMSARPLLVRYESLVPSDPRPRSALAAAESFARGARRSVIQRATALEAHRAAAEALDEVAQLAARACGDAAASAYLHPIARATQVGHILRAAACAARVAELDDGDGAAAASLRATRARGTPTLVAVLRRYPAAPEGTSRLAQLMSALDADLRANG